MAEARTAAARRSYDRVASSYRERFEGELDDKPFDRAFLDVLERVTPADGWVIDLGCGPGQIGRYLARQGLRVGGVDLSLGMLRQARSLLGAAVQSDMAALPFGDGSVLGVVAFYSLIHLSPIELGAAAGEIHRVLVAGGNAAIAVHTTAPPERGAPDRDGRLHVEEMLSQPVDLDFYFYRADQLRRAFEEAGFAIVSIAERDAYPDEVPTRRAYMLMRRLG